MHQQRTILSTPLHQFSSCTLLLHIILLQIELLCVFLTRHHLKLHHRPNPHQNTNCSTPLRRLSSCTFSLSYHSLVKRALVCLSKNAPPKKLSCPILSKVQIVLHHSTNFLPSMFVHFHPSFKRALSDNSPTKPSKHHQSPGCLLAFSIPITLFSKELVYVFLKKHHLNFQNLTSPQDGRWSSPQTAGPHHTSPPPASAGSTPPPPLQSEAPGISDTNLSLQS